jgi:hypothetical protein
MNRLSEALLEQLAHVGSLLAGGIAAVGVVVFGVWPAPDSKPDRIRRFLGSVGGADGSEST